MHFQPCCGKVRDIVLVVVWYDSLTYSVLINCHALISFSFFTLQKTLCDGCIFAHRDVLGDFSSSCPFCRDQIATSDKERMKKTEERLKHGDSDAFYMLGAYYFAGKPPLKQNHKKGLEMMNQAAELGSEIAHYSLGMAYARGVGVEKNDAEAFQHLRLAAIGGILEAFSWTRIPPRKSKSGIQTLSHRCRGRA